MGICSFKFSFRFLGSLRSILNPTALRQPSQNLAPVHFIIRSTLTNAPERVHKVVRCGTCVFMCIVRPQRSYVGRGYRRVYAAALTVLGYPLDGAGVDG